ncbi:hypothetical protein A6U84_23615 (plasmid) [Agrobacterium sp. 13-2099-1-2]|uniref:AI-2E family transporter n=1 Tax=Agrobacterium sp. 13-2099-1-2 TaxID=1841651 RepID=UPI00080FEA2E|nr:hypothetical protein [Agrobacterium sp. 13-2099-1-2]UZX45354.1 hypothetical protein A6U84_23615 [Agrobacterium sp. 13-2099-1-2]
MGQTSIEGVTFMAVVVLVTTAFFFLLLPYYGTVLWVTIVVILFYPLHERLCRWFGGRRNLAAAASVICFVCIVLIPGSIVLGSLADEATRLYGRISEREFDAVQILQRIRDALPSPVVHALSALQIGDVEPVQSRIATSLGQARAGDRIARDNDRTRHDGVDYQPRDHALSAVLPVSGWA